MKHVHTLIIFSFFALAGTQAKSIRITKIKNESQDQLSLYDCHSKKTISVPAHTEIEADIDLKRPLKLSYQGKKRKIYGDSSWRPFRRHVRITESTIHHGTFITAVPSPYSSTGLGFQSTNADYKVTWARHVRGCSDIKTLKKAPRTLAICPLGTFSLS